MEKILQKGIHKDIPYQIKINYDYDYFDDVKLTLIDTEFNEAIGYLIYVEELFDSDISAISEINDIVENYNPMYLKQIYINDEYKLMGFGNLLMQYFVNNIVDYNICLLLKSSFSVDSKLKEKLDEEILPKFYEKFGFQQYENSNWYLLNFDNI